MTTRIAAVFPNLSQAQAAIVELRDAGLKDRHLSVLTRALDEGAYPAGAYKPAGPLTQSPDPKLVAVGPNAAELALKGLVGGAGVGALFGLAAALIPGAGPFIAAGALASALGSTAGAMTAGAVVGATSGAIGASLARLGWTEEEATYYGQALASGRVLLTIDFDEHQGLTRDAINQVLARHEGRLTMANAATSALI